MLKKVQSLLKVLVIASLLQSTVFASYLVQLSPDTINTNTGQKESKLVITNPKDTPVALEVLVSERIPSASNMEGGEIESKDLLLVPNKVIVLPGQEKKINITYRGKTPSHERQYYVLTKEIKIPKKTEESVQLTLLTNYKKIFSVSSTRFKDNLKLDANKRVVDAKDMLELEFENKGTRFYASIRMRGVQVKTNKGKFDIPRQVFMDDEEQFIVFPKQKITRLVPWPKDMPENAKIKSVKLTR